MNSSNPALSVSALRADNSHLRLPPIAAACTGLLNRVSDAWWERRLGIQTSGRKQIAHADAERFEPVPYAVLERILARLAPTPDAVVVDLGSGKGRLVCGAALRPLRQVIGVEIDPALHADAERNAARLRGRRAPIRLFCQSATEFDCQDVDTVLLFNPFGEATMRVVLAQLRRSWEQRPRPLQIAYVNAVCGHLFAAEPWLELYDCWRMKAWSRLRSPVQFYRSRPRR